MVENSLDKLTKYTKGLLLKDCTKKKRKKIAEVLLGPKFELAGGILSQVINSLSKLDKKQLSNYFSNIEDDKLSLEIMRELDKFKDCKDLIKCRIYTAIYMREYNNSEFLKISIPTLVYIIMLAFIYDMDPPLDNTILNKIIHYATYSWTLFPVIIANYLNNKFRTIPKYENYLTSTYLKSQTESIEIDYSI